jgi:hypothetical protein
VQWQIWMTLYRVLFGNATRTFLITAAKFTARHLRALSWSHIPITTPHLTLTLTLSPLSPLSPITANMSFRPGFRTFGSAFQPFRNAFRQSFGRRWQSATAEAAPAAKAEKEKLNPFSWNSPVGPKTVHFWYAFHS